MKRTYLFLFFCHCIYFSHAQVPLGEIEGRLSIFLPDDSTSVHIGKNAGVNQNLNANRRNTYIGTDAGRSSDFENNNTYVGYLTGANSEEAPNSFFGSGAGNTNSGRLNSFFGTGTGGKSQGDYNSFFGDISGESNIGSYNSFFGAESGSGNRGDNNSFVGYASGVENEGSDNSFIGSESGLSNQSGNYNNYFGSKSGYKNTTGSRNVGIGANALKQAKQKSDNIAIGDSAMYGVGIIDEPTFFGQRNVAIGTRAFYGVDSEYGRNSVAIGYEAGMDGGQRSVFLGYQAGKNITELDDVLYINNVSGTNPLVYGEFDNSYLQINGDLESTGKLSVGTSPGNWKAMIREAGNALDGNNVDVSNLAMMIEKQNPAPNEAVGIGFKSSSETTDVGAAIIHERTSNFSLGKMHFATKTSAVAGADIPIHLTINESGLIGMGTQDPQFKAVIRETGNALSADNVDISNLAMVLEKGSNTAGQGIGIGFQSSSTASTVGGAIIFERTGSGSKGHLHFATKESSGADEDIPIRMTIEDFGNVGIGTTDPETTLDVLGTIRGTSVFCGGINACSDMRLKKDFTQISNPLALVQQLNGYFHYWKDDEYPDWQFTDQRVIGFKAQEVEMILPEVVTSMPDDYLSIDYGKIVPLLVEAIKEQQAIIDNQQKEIGVIKAILSKTNSLED